MVFKNKNEEILRARCNELYSTEGDVRSDYFRDYNRILHSNAYRRLKHKTQVFFNINNDHICTRVEHVSHVAGVSHSIAVGLNLDTDLTNAIACGHDIGHAPFGHEGEKVLNKLMQQHLSEEYKEKIAGKDNPELFWHEKNGLRFVDYIELLNDPYGTLRNLNLTYAVRDGIVSHCGENDENELHPRDNCIDLNDFKKKGQFMPATWEGCVVKISDKIAYLGRDIEDAIALNILTKVDLDILRKMAVKFCQRETLNTTGIMHSLIGDICANSTPDKGICMSYDKYELYKCIKAYNYEKIYRNEKFDIYKEYVEMVLRSIFNKLLAAYEGNHTISNLIEKYNQTYPKLTRNFCIWLGKYCATALLGQIPDDMKKSFGSLENEKIYGDLTDKDLYIQAIVDFISGMTDSYAITIFNELLSFS